MIEMKFYLEKKYSIYGTSYYRVYRVDGVCYGECDSPWEFLRERLRRGVKFQIVDKPQPIAQQPQPENAAALAV